jgi:protein disulfide-isomerase A1
MALSRLLLAVASALLLACAVVAEISKENGVLVLTDDNFSEALEKYPDGLLVEMYAPWCGHCKKLQPAYDAAAKELETHGLPLAKIDAAEHKEVAQKYEVRGFPTIKYFSNGKSTDYQGGRTTEDIVNFVVKKSGPPAVPLESQAAVEKFADGSEAVVVAYFSDAAAPAASAFTAVANEMDDIQFGVIADAKTAEAVGVADGTIAVLKKFDEKKNDLATSKKTSSDEIKEFVQVHSLPLVIKFSPETSRQIFGGSIQVHSLIFSDELEGDLLESFTAAAKDNRGKLLHVHVPSSETRVTEYFGITKEQMPTIMIADMTKAVKKYAFGDRELTKDGIASFEKEFLAGKLSPTLKSEEPSDEDTANPVKIIKGKSFEDIVVKNKNDVFVKMHAPWCGHCKALAPTWDELAEKLKDVDTVTIAKMDATANEVDYPGADVEGFPTLLFFPGNDKANPVKYEGGRELDALASWLKEHASTKFELSDSKGEEKPEGSDEL